MPVGGIRSNRNLNCKETNTRKETYFNARPFMKIYRVVQIKVYDGVYSIN